MENKSLKQIIDNRLEKLKKIRELGVEPYAYDYKCSHHSSEINEKLIDRGIRIIVKLTGVDYQLANSKLLDADKSVKTAIVMIKYNCSKEDALFKLNKHQGFLRNLL